MSSKSSRLEWVSLLYLVFFVLAVLSPSLHVRGYFGLSETRIEEITIFFFGIAGLVTFTIYERLMERREKEREQAQNQFKKAQGELIDSYAYIGSINRKIELLKKLANDASLATIDRSAIPKELFSALVASAASAAGADQALIRFVELNSLRTAREFHHPEGKNGFRVSNRQLRELHERGTTHEVIRAEDGRSYLVVPSDRKQDRKAYVLFPLGETVPTDIDVSLLKIFANQAEMLYHHLVHQTEGVEVSLAEPAKSG